jgi:hypothetical protein
LTKNLEFAIIEIAIEMGKYYGVRAIMRRGKKIGNIEHFREQPRVQEDEALIGIVSNALWVIAADLTSTYEYEAFRKAYAEGYYVAIILFKIKKTELVNCPDEGRVDIEEFKDSELYKELLGIQH